MLSWWLNKLKISITCAKEKIIDYCEEEELKHHMLNDMKWQQRNTCRKDEKAAFLQEFISLFYWNFAV